VAVYETDFFFGRVGLKMADPVAPPLVTRLLKSLLGLDVDVSEGISRWLQASGNWPKKGKEVWVYGELHFNMSAI